MRKPKPGFWKANLSLSLANLNIFFYSNCKDSPQWIFSQLCTVIINRAALLKVGYLDKYAQRPILTKVAGEDGPDLAPQKFFIVPKV